MKQLISLRRIRQIYGVFFLGLFFVFLYITDFRHLKGYEVNLFLKIDPLVTVGSLLTSWTVYRGLALGLIIIVLTLFFGRFFCSWLCPLGVINQWMSNFFNRRRPVDDYQINTYRRSYTLKYYILTALLALSITGTLQVGLLDPISLITRSFALSVLPGIDRLTGLIYPRSFIYHASLFIGILFLVILFLNRFLTRLWCRMLCPLGALLGLVGRFSLLRIWRDVGRCTDCMKCLRRCHGGCNPHGEIIFSECHLCMNCIEDCPEGAIHYGLRREKSSLQKLPDLNRRRLIETALGGLVLYPLMRGTISAATRPLPGAIRPPGALREDDFLRRCIKCGECMRVCPANAIQPALLETGLEGLWTPILVFKTGYCEFNCVLCSRVCPTGAIRQISIEEKIGAPPFKEPIRMGTAFYDRGRCLPWAMNTECIVCEEVCPTSPKAIWFEHKEIRNRDGTTRVLKLPHLDPTLCVGCGICEYKCPVHDRAAIRVTSIGESRSTVNRLLLEGDAAGKR